MNSIRFRAWDKEPSLCTDKPTMHYYSPLEISDMSLNFWSKTHIECEPDELVIMRCTGRSAAKSCRGDRPEDLLIYEGDVVRLDGEDYVVRWNPKYCAFVLKDCEYGLVLAWENSGATKDCAESRFMHHSFNMVVVKP